MKRIGIKFCGGCNPKYDRREMLNKIKDIATENYSFQTVKRGERYDILIVISGCNNSCADCLEIYYENKIVIKKDMNSSEISDLLLKLI